MKLPNRFPAVVVCAVMMAGSPRLAAQNLQGLVSGLFSGAEAEARAEPPAAEQLTWAEERRREAEAGLREVAGKEWAARAAAEGWDEDARARLERTRRELVETWTSAIGVLQAVILREEKAGEVPPPPPVPRSPAEAEALEKRVEELVERLARGENQKAVVEAALAEARRSRDQLGMEISAAERELESAGDDGERAARARVKLELARAGHALAGARIFSLRWQQYRDGMDLESLASELERARAALRASGLDRVLSTERAASRLEDARKRLPAVERAAEEAERRLAELSSQVEKWRGEQERRPEARQRLQAALPELELRELRQQVARGRAAAVRQEIALWELVEQTASRNDLASLDAARRRTAEDVSAIASAQARLAHRLEGLSRAGGAATPVTDGSDAVAALRREAEALRDELRELETAHRRVRAAIEAEMERLRREQTFGAVAHEVRSSVSRILNTRVFSAAGRVFTLGGLLLTVAAVAAAIVASRVFSVWASRQLARRFHLGQSQSHLVEKLTLYTLTVILTFSVLQWLNIPLTIFAFLGGALAVGVGFGSQNLINNFISGLLLLLERKINVGDLVEVDGRTGRVTSLGSRCSTIRLFDGVEVLVPNSLLLEKNVINWTLSDPYHRYEIRIGLAYGSDVALAFRTLEEAVGSRPEILRDPPPGVFLVNFGESSLDFVIFYWLEVGGPNPLQAGSDLRREILRLCRERGLEIPFPQREVRVSGAGFPGSLESPRGLEPA